MKILYLDQPLKNRGDESAHRGIVNWLNDNYPQATVEILFWDETDSNIKEFIVDSPLDIYVNIKPLKGAHFALVNGIDMPYLWHLHPTTRSLMKKMKEADYILCSPGGVNMGGFQGWEHVAMLKMGLSTHTPVIYYGRSVGPFPAETRRQRHFLEESTKLLRGFTYLSVRDSESARTLNSMDIDHEMTVDCAFLSDSLCGIPSDITDKIGSDYAVIVPNILYWHYAFKDVKHRRILDFYSGLVNSLLDRFQGLNLVMLPQTYNEHLPERIDHRFFKEIEREVNNPRVIVLPETIGSDIQQSIIRDARFLFGSRYHSVVFAINQSTPFMALSYEHKISGLLKLLDLTECAIEITSESFASESSISRMTDRCIDGIINADRKKVSQASIKAKALARERIQDLKNIIK